MEKLNIYVFPFVRWLQLYRILITGKPTSNCPVAVITNASLIHLPDVQQELLEANYVSVKADTFNVETWRKINLPHKPLDLQE